MKENHKEWKIQCQYFILISRLYNYNLEITFFDNYSKILCYIQTSKRIIDSLKDFSMNDLAISLIFFGTSIRGSLIKYVDYVLFMVIKMLSKHGSLFKNQDI